TVCSVLQLRTAQPGDHLRQPASAGEVPRPAPALACPRHHRSRSLAVAADRQDLYATIGSEWYFPTGKPNLLCAAEAAWSFGDHLGRWEKKRVGNLRGPPGIQEHPHQGLAKPVDGFPGISGADMPRSDLHLATDPPAHPYLYPGYDVTKHLRV